MAQAQWQMKTSLGPLFLVASEKGLQSLFWNQQQVPMANSLTGSEQEIQILADAVQQVEEYLKGERKEFEISLDLSGTDFQKQVWSELQKIPYGETISYSQLAKKLKKEKAVRAIGTANGKNPLCLVIPCHRVIAADGSLGGYSGGLSVKSQLLQIESAGNFTRRKVEGPSL